MSLQELDAQRRAIMAVLLSEEMGHPERDKLRKKFEENCPRQTNEEAIKLAKEMIASHEARDR